jgi:hypothetical protein
MRNTSSSTRWRRMLRAATLLRSRRQQPHARIAATLEDRFPETCRGPTRVARPAPCRSRLGGEGGRLLSQGWSAGDGALTSRLDEGGLSDTGPGRRREKRSFSEGADTRLYFMLTAKEVRCILGSEGTKAGIWSACPRFSSQSSNHASGCPWGRLVG